jgi:hypothetical protein
MNYGDYRSLNAHEQERRKLWNAAYIRAMAQRDTWTHAELQAEADAALEAFDWRFPSP